MTGLDVAHLSALISLHGGTMFAAVLEHIAREPVRYAGLVISGVILAVSAVTGTPVAVVLAQIVAVIAALERVRAVVTPMIRVIVHEQDLPSIEDLDLEEDLLVGDEG